MKIINIAKDFTIYPYGRYLADGRFSGERLRNEFLLPALQSQEGVEVILDGVQGYGSSFLEEAFAGLVRVHNIKKEDLLNRLSFVSKDDPSLVVEIKKYIEEA